ncbi:MAG: LuxR C-terminal-related transcriptional regulator [Pseudomonadota bacterium]
MAIDQSVLLALKHAVRSANEDAPRPIPAGVLEPLIKVSRPGLHMNLDLEASNAIGAPLITVMDQPTFGQLLAPLTKRQKDVAGLIIDGFSNREIAEQLGISLSTAKDHVHAILARLDLKSRTALVSAARRNG